MKPVRRLAGSVLVATTLTLTACSSSGGGAPSQDQLLKKLKTDPTLSQLRTSLPAQDKGKFDTFLSCAAKKLRNDASGKELTDYVNGKKKIEDVHGDKDAAEADVKSCLKSAGLPGS